MSSQDKAKVKKGAELTDFCEKTTPKKLKNLARVPHEEDWRRSRVTRIKHKIASIT